MSWQFGSFDWFWDQANKRMGVNRNNPSYTLDVNGIINGTNFYKSGSIFVPNNYIIGLEYSHAADSDHDITLATGTCTDSTNTYVMTLSSSLTKKLDVSPWAAGTNQGGLFSGSIAANTIYYLHLIRGTSSGNIDVGFDTSITAANIPAGYSSYRLVATFITDASSNIVQTIPLIRGNIIQQWFKTAYVVIATGLTATTYTSQTLTYVPTGLSQLEAWLTGINITDNPSIKVSLDGVNDLAYLPGGYSEELYYTVGRFLPLGGVTSIYYRRGAGTGSYTLAYRGIRYWR
jgi:hypothetical protein